MSEDRSAGRVVSTAPCRHSFPNLLEPKKVKGKDGKEKGEAKFSDNFMFAPDHVDLAVFKAAAAKVAKARFPGVPLSDIRFPFKDGTKLADTAKAKGKDQEFNRGMVVLVARSKYRPKMTLLDGGQARDLETDEAVKAHISKFFGGSQVLCQVTFAAYENDDDSKGVNAYLDHVLTLNKGERIGGGRAGADVFKGYVGTVTTDDPTAGMDGMDDEIPF